MFYQIEDLVFPCHCWWLAWMPGQDLNRGSHAKIFFGGKSRREKREICTSRACSPPRLQGCPTSFWKCWVEILHQRWSILWAFSALRILPGAAGDQGRAEWRTFATAGHRRRCDLLWSTQNWKTCFFFSIVTLQSFHSIPDNGRLDSSLGTALKFRWWQESERCGTSKIPVRRGSWNRYLIGTYILPILVMQKLFSWISFQCRPLAPPRARPVCPTMFRVQTRSLRSLSFICDVFECLMFNGSILSLLCRVRECLCWRVRTSMRRSQKRRQTNYPKRGRERDRSCRPFPVRAFVCPCEVCLCCTFVFLCVCVCQSLLVSFLAISAHSRGHTGSWMAWATEDPSKLLWKCPCFLTWWWNNA